MSIGTITVSRLKTVVMLGHSRMDGWGQSDYLFAQHADLQPINGPDVRVNPQLAYWKDVFVATSPQPFPGPSHTPTAADAGDVEWLELTIANVDNQSDPHPHAHPYNYPNNRGSCYPRHMYNAWIVSGFTGFHDPYNGHYSFAYDTEVGGPFVVGETLTFGTPTASGRLVALTDNGTTGLMTIALDVDDDPPVNNTTILGGTSAATAAVDGAVTLAASRINGTLVGLEIPWMANWRNYWGEQVGLVKVAFSSTFMLPAEYAVAATEQWLDVSALASSAVAPFDVPGAVDITKGPFYAYWTPAEQFDLSPATKRIFKIWLDKMVGAAEALPAGTEMDVPCVILWTGDNDAQARSRFTLETTFKDSWRKLRDIVRQTIAANGWSTLPAEQIAVLAPSIGPGYGSALAATQGLDSVAFCNEAIRELAGDDPYMRWVDSSGWSQLSDEPEAPPFGMGTGTTHESHNGYIEANADLWAAWQSIVTQSLDAFSPKDRVTVADAITALRRRYDRGGTSSDISDDVAIDFLNQAIRHIVNCAADSCWWLNRRINMELSFDSSGVASLPEFVARALWIENPLSPKDYIPFEQIGFGDGGRCQIVLTNGFRAPSSTTTYKVRHIFWPPTITGTEQDMPVPRQILEWVIVEAAKRLASGASDVAKSALLGGEAREIMERCMRQIGAQQRQAKDALHNEQPHIRLKYR
jgi:hypothetical protein